MANHSDNHESRVAVLVDCDNVSPAILDHALEFVAQFGRVVRTVLDDVHDRVDRERLEQREVDALVVARGHDLVVEALV